MGTRPAALPPAPPAPPARCPLMATDGHGHRLGHRAPLPPAARSHDRTCHTASRATVSMLKHSFASRQTVCGSGRGGPAPRETGVLWWDSSPKKFHPDKTTQQVPSRQTTTTRHKIPTLTTNRLRAVRHGGVAVVVGIVAYLKCRCGNHLRGRTPRCHALSTLAVEGWWRGTIKTRNHRGSVAYCAGSGCGCVG